MYRYIHICLQSESWYLWRGWRRHHHRELREGQLTVTVRVRSGEHLLHLQLYILDILNFKYSLYLLHLPVVHRHRQMLHHMPKLGLKYLDNIY